MAVEHMRRSISAREGLIAKRIVELRERSTPTSPQVTLTITTCRRYSLFRRTIDSFLACCQDFRSIDRWIVVDDGSSPGDRERMRRRYPFFEWLDKPAEERGHAHSMNALLRAVNSRYWLHLEDDFEFFEPRAYVADAIDILEDEPRLGQVLFNRAYAEDCRDRDIYPGRPRRTRLGQRYLVHGYRDQVPGRSAAWWPHFSLRPSLMARDAIARIGEFRVEAENFELEFAQRYAGRELQSAFFDTICAEHIGRKVGQRGDDATPNAYQLAGASQFGAQPSKVKVVATITSCKRVGLLQAMLESLQRHCRDLDRVARWVCLDDGSDEGELRDLAARFPHLEIIRKPEERRGHALSMNQILEESSGRFLLHLEDDWEFTRDFHLGPLVDVLVSGSCQQIAFTRRPHGMPATDMPAHLELHEVPYLANHPHKPQHFRDFDANRGQVSEPRETTAESGYWWPGFTLNPSLFDRSFFCDVVGAMSPELGDDLFEYDYALRARAAGARCLETDLGLVHRGEISAYVLNERRRSWDPAE
jgi:glycosyltransferase involved in cell wall biosynthesis